MARDSGNLQRRIDLPIILARKLRIGPEWWRAKLKTCKSSLPTSHPLLLLVCRVSSQENDGRQVGPQENKTKINASWRISGESIYWANWDWSAVFQLMLRKLLRSEFSAPASENSNSLLLRIEIEKENHLFYGIESWDRQVTCSEKKLHAHATWPFKDGQKKFRRVPQFLVLKILQTKYSLQSSEFLLTKDREIADNVHQGPLSIDFDDEWIRA